MRALSANLPIRVNLAAVVGCLLSTCFLPLARGQNPPVKFVSAIPIATGPNTGGYKAVTGFFNRDTKPDFMYSAISFDSTSPRSFSEVVLNSGNGTFHSLTANPNDLGPDLAADLNGDGITDVIYYNPQYFGPGVDVKYGVGDGTFANEAGFNVDSAFSYVLDAVAGDFNGDGAIDLAVLTGANKLVIMLNDRRGALAPAFSYALPAPPSGTSVSALSVGELNGDGRPDLILTYQGPNGTITPYLATTGGAFLKGTSLTVGGTVWVGATIADVNHDGRGDLALVTSAGTKIFLGNASATFTLASTMPNRGSLLAFADFNKDGAKDLAIAGPDSVSVAFGKNNGTFQNLAVYAAARSPFSFFAVDLNGSGNVDLVAADYEDATLYRMQNDGTGHFAAAPITSSPAATGIVAADFNHDGKKDVAVVNTPQCKSPCRGSVSVFPGSGANYFNAAAKYTIGMHGSAIAAGDLNGDGILDLVIANSFAGDSADTSVLLGNKDGTFQPAHNYILGSLSSELYLTDLNKDGRLDLVEHGGVALGKGNGTFATFVPLPSGLSNDPSLHLAVGDMNGDGKPDVLAATSAEDGCTGSLQVLLGNGKGGFTLGQNVFLDTPENINSVVLGRLRVGGAMDVVYSSTGICGIQNGAETISLAAGFLGNGKGTGTFNTTRFNVASGAIVGPPVLTGPVVIADFNGDGKVDVGIGAGDYFEVSTGKGDGTFSEGGSFRTAGTNGIAVADFTSDGRTDVAITSSWGISRLYNITQPLP